MYIAIIAALIVLLVVPAASAQVPPDFWGLTGNSGGWIDESVDLSEFAGAEVLIRFEYVTDDAVNINGACFDDIAIPEIGFFDDAESATGPGDEWIANGFARIDPEVPQEWFVTLVRRLPDGRQS